MPQENTVISSTFTYGNASSGQMPDAVYSIQSASTLKRTYEYDSLGRRTQENVYIGDKLLFKNAYSFASSSVDADDDFARSTNLVRMYSTKTGWYGYTYDANGNMSSMLFNKTGGTMNGVWYYYDGLNRLTRINDNIVGKTYTYSYDANGNITSKTECDYTTKDIPADATRINYTYDSTWKDLLVQYGSKSITYDAIGNPTRIGDSTLTWTGRQLDSYSDGTNNCSFTYDINGQRYKKTVNGTATEYYYGDGKLFAQKTGGRVLLFRYDENDLPIGVTVRENSTRKNYFYVKNVQGDITAIVDSTGNIVAEYSYDVWGKIIGMTDTSDTGIGTANPLRYRGYYYDSETGFYLTGTRYYNPEFGRFINADSQIAGVGGEILGYNMFAYCMNNPVNMSDPSGNWPKLSTVFTVASVVGVVVAAVAVTVVTCGAAAPALAVAGGGIISAGAVATATSVATGALIVAGAATTAAIVATVVENTSYRGTVRNQSVYVMRDKTTGDVQYVGRTNNPIRRQGEHAKDPKKANLQPLEVKFSGLTKLEARAMEQVLISAYSLDNLINARREIATGNVIGFAGKIGNIISIFGGMAEDELLNLMGR